MATKKTGDVPAPEAEPKKPVEEPGDVPDSKPELKPEPPVLSERFQGKKIEDVIEMFEKAEKERDRSGTEVGKLRGELDDTKNKASYFQNTAQDLRGKLERRGTQPEGEAEPDTTGFYDNPLPLMTQVIQRELKKDREIREKAEGEQEYQRASMNFATGRSEAMKANPELFKGIEKQVEQGMWNYWKAKRITAEDLGKPRTWADGARMVHMANEDYDRIVPPKIVPLSPTLTETPGAAKIPSEEEVPTMELDAFGEEMREHAIKGGMDEKDFNKLVQETKKREGR